MHTYATLEGSAYGQGDPYSSDYYYQDDMDPWQYEDHVPGETAMPRFLGTTNPCSEVSSQWESKPALDIEMFERGLEYQAGIMDDYEEVDPSPISSQATQVYVPGQIFVSPEWLSLGISATATVHPGFQVPDVVANNLQYNQPAPTAVMVEESTTTSSSSPSTDCQASQLPTPPCTIQDRPRRGRGRTKLPVEELKKTRRRLTKPGKCPYCNMGHEWKRDLKRHLISEHKERAMQEGHLTEKDVKRTPCAYCDQSFVRPDYLPRHLKGKHGSVKR